MEQIILK